MLDGTTDKEDARLMADIMAAPDAFDGGCAADVEPAKPINQKDDLSEWVMDKLHQWKRDGIREGVLRASRICLDAGHIEAAELLGRKFDEINV